MDPSAFGVNRDAFNANVDLLIKQVKESRVAEGFTEVFVPGEQGQKKDSCSLSWRNETDRADYGRLENLLVSPKASDRKSM